MSKIQQSGEVSIPPSAERELVPLNIDEALRALRELVKPDPAPA